jgi:sensor histidine kinase regulating citrate/malate metabolism
LRRRLEGSGVILHGEPTAELVSPTLFDSFIENALENARAKSAGQPGIAIEITFHCEASECVLSVMDDGSAVPAVVARRLFEHPIERDNGLGIGLFHMARLARQSGFELTLPVNRDGRVCFALLRGRGFQ